MYSVVYFDSKKDSKVVLTNWIDTANNVCYLPEDRRKEFLIENTPIQKDWPKLQCSNIKYKSDSYEKCVSKRHKFSKGYETQDLLTEHSENEKAKRRKYAKKRDLDYCYSPLSSRKTKKSAKETHKTSVPQTAEVEADCSLSSTSSILSVDSQTIFSSKCHTIKSSSDRKDKKIWQCLKNLSNNLSKCHEDNVVWQEKVLLRLDHIENNVNKMKKELKSLAQHEPIEICSSSSSSMNFPIESQESLLEYEKLLRENQIERKNLVAWMINRGGTCVNEVIDILFRDIFSIDIGCYSSWTGKTNKKGKENICLSRTQVIAALEESLVKRKFEFNSKIISRGMREGLRRSYDKKYQTDRRLNLAKVNDL